jgi:hypothetical protein
VEIGRLFPAGKRRPNRLSGRELPVSGHGPYNAG